MGHIILENSLGYLKNSHTLYLTGQIIIEISCNYLWTQDLLNKYKMWDLSHLYNLG